MYTLNVTAARSANDGNKFISDAGKYVGLFQRAENIESAKGSKGVEFTFSTGQQEADYLKLWTMNKDGKELHGFKVLNAIMACLKVRGITPQQGTIEKYDHEAKAKVKKQASIFPELMNKQIGLLLQVEEYRNSAGKLKTKMAIFAPFEASTELTADEILDSKVQPAKLQKLVQFIADNPVRKLKDEDQHTAQHANDFYHNAAGNSSGFDQFGDDIPF